MASHHPTEIKLHQQSRTLEIIFSSGHQFIIPCEFLRVHSPSAEVRGHQGVGGKLVTDKQQVSINQIIPIGQYAVKIVFSDGHRSGLYDWDYLFRLGNNQEQLWQEYLEKCSNVGTPRQLS